MTISTAAELSWLGNSPLWLAVMDFKKAFDSVEHQPLFKAPIEQGVQEQYVEILKKVYAHQEGYVSVETESKIFPMTRGSKQGDPISPAIVCWRNSSAH